MVETFHTSSDKHSYKLPSIRTLDLVQCPKFKKLYVDVSYKNTFRLTVKIKGFN
jgi:hypothetical protein